MFQKNEYVLYKYMILHLKIFLTLILTLFEKNNSATKLQYHQAYLNDCIFK